jgi:hypothetical protein
MDIRTQTPISIDQPLNHLGLEPNPKVNIGPTIPVSQSIIVVEPSTPVGFEPQDLYQKYKTVSSIEHHGETLEASLNNFVDQKLSERNFGPYNQFSGIYKSIGSALSQGQKSVSSTTSDTIFKTRIKDFDPANHVDRTIESRNKGISTALSMTTHDGDKINLNINLDYTRGKLDGNAGRFTSRNLEIDIQIDGDLNDQEKEAIERLSQAIDQQITRVMNGDEFNFTKLNFFSDSNISEIEFKLKQGPTNNNPLSFKLTNTEAQRSIFLRSGLQEIDIQLDLTSGITGKPDQQQVIEAFIRSIEDGLDKSKDITGKGQALIDAARSIFSNIAGNSDINTVTRLGMAVMSGLPDFTLNYSNAEKGLMGTETLVDINAKQNTTIRQENLKLNLSQKYDFNINYQYETPLPHLKLVDKENENYIQHQVSENQSRISRLTTDDNGFITKASISKNASETHMIDEYREGKNVLSEVNVRTRDAYQDHISEIVEAEANNDLLIIKGIMEHLDY